MTSFPFEIDALIRTVTFESPFCIVALGVPGAARRIDLAFIFVCVGKWRVKNHRIECVKVKLPHIITVTQFHAFGKKTFFGY